MADLAAVGRARHGQLVRSSATSPRLPLAISTGAKPKLTSEDTRASRAPPGTPPADGELPCLPRPSMIPPLATTGTWPPTAATTWGIKAQRPTSDCNAAGSQPAKALRWPPASVPCAMTPSAPAATAHRFGRRRHHREQRTARTACQGNRGTRVLERRDERRARPDRGLQQRKGSVGPARRRVLGRQSELLPERCEHAGDESRSPVAGVRAASCTFTPTGPSPARALAASVARATASTVIPVTPSTPAPPQRETSLTSAGVFGPPAMPASNSACRMPRRSQSDVRSGLAAAGTSNPLLSIDRLQPRDATPLLQHFKC